MGPKMEMVTQFFHRMAIGRRMRNFIEKLEVEGLSVIENEKDIEAEIIKFVKKLYNSNKEVGWTLERVNWHCISTVEAEQIELPFEEGKVKRATFDCGKDKAPGPKQIFLVHVTKLLGFC